MLPRLSQLGQLLPWVDIPTNRTVPGGSLSLSSSFDNENA